MSALLLFHVQSVEHTPDATVRARLDIAIGGQIFRGLYAELAWQDDGAGGLEFGWVEGGLEELADPFSWHAREIYRLIGELGEAELRDRFDCCIWLVHGLAHPELPARAANDG